MQLENKAWFDFRKLPKTLNWVAGAKLLAIGVAGLVVAVGSWVLIDAGWGFGGAGWFNMDVAVAFGFMLAGLTLGGRLDENAGPWRQGITSGGALVLAVWGVVDLRAFLSGAGPVDRNSGGVMDLIGGISPVAAGGFALLGIAMLCMDRRWVGKFGRGVALLICLLGSLLWISFLFRWDGLLKLSRDVNFSMATKGLLALLGAGILAARPQQGLLPLFTSETMGGKTVRRILPLVLLLPTGLGWLRLQGVDMGWFSDEAGSAIMILSGSLITGLVVLWFAHSLHVVDQNRRSVEAALAIKERASSRFMEGLPIAAYTTDAEGRIETFNQAAVKLWGQTPEVGQRWCGSHRLFSAEGEPIAHHECPTARTLKENKSYHGCEAMGGRPDGSRFNFMAFPTPFRDRAGALVGAMNAMVDITELKKTEVRLQRLKRTATFLSAVNQLLVREREITKVYQEACHIAIERGGFCLAWVEQFDSSTGIAMPVAMAGSTVVPEHKVMALVKAWSGAAGEDNELPDSPVIVNDLIGVIEVAAERGLCEQNSLRAVVVLPLTIHGKVTGVLYLCADKVDVFDDEEMTLLVELARDLSFAQEVDQLTKERAIETALVEKEQRLFTSLVDATTDFIYFKDRDSKFVRINPELARSLGLPDPIDAVGKSDADYFGPSHARETWEAEQNLLATGQPIVAMEANEIWPDGKTRWVSTTKVPMRDEHGKIVGLVGISRDTTESKQLEMQFLRAQRMEAMGMLCGGVAHDLNNILSPMFLAAGLLKDKVSDDKSRRILGMVESGATRGAQIVRQLMTFSRGMEGARISLHLRHLLGEVISLAQVTFPRDIEVGYFSDKTLSPVMADAIQIHQVLMNLCINARDAMAHGGKLTLEAKNLSLKAEEVMPDPALVEGEYVVVVVSDTGCGMTQAVMDRIFEPFYTTKDMSKGTGLGLSTVYGIVKNHGGVITVQSEPGVGTTFSVYLPATADAAELMPEEVKAPGLPRGKKQLILLVDDEINVRKAMKLLLEKHNYEVLVAPNGKEALARFVEKNGEVELVVTDLSMPEMDGVNLTKALRLIDAKTPVIGMSGFDQEEKPAELFEAGVSELLSKPFSASGLLAAVDRYLVKDDQRMPQELKPDV